MDSVAEPVMIVVVVADDDVAVYYQVKKTPRNYNPVSTTGYTVLVLTLADGLFTLNVCVCVNVNVCINFNILCMCLCTTIHPIQNLLQMLMLTETQILSVNRASEFLCERGLSV